MKILLTSIDTPSILRKKIMDMSKKNGLTQPCFEKMLDYTIDIFESNGLGTAYYGYHNIDHELVSYTRNFISLWRGRKHYRTFK